MRCGFLALLAAVVLVVPSASVRAVPPPIVHGGRTFGAFVNVDPVLGTMIADTGELPGTGGSLQASATGVVLDSVFSAEFLHARADSSRYGVDCFAKAVTLSVLPGTPASITATEVSASVFANCGGSASGVSVTGLVFGGTPVEGIGGSNQVVTIPGVATLTIHEQVDGLMPGSSEIAVNALHLRLATGGEVIVLSSRAQVSNCVTAVHATPWSGVKSFYK